MNDLGLQMNNHGFLCQPNSGSTNNNLTEMSNHVGNDTPHFESFNWNPETKQKTPFNSKQNYINYASHHCQPNLNCTSGSLSISSKATNHNVENFHFSIEYLAEDVGLPSIEPLTSDFNQHESQNPDLVLPTTSATKFQPILYSLMTSKMLPCRTAYSKCYPDKFDSSRVCSGVPETSASHQTAMPISKMFQSFLNDSESKPTKGQKRNKIALPQPCLNLKAVDIMEDWYSSHSDHPYPNKTEKVFMAEKGRISLSQVHSWFSNRRNRANNTRPKQEMKKMVIEINTLCHELQVHSQGLLNSEAISKRLIKLFNEYYSR